MSGTYDLAVIGGGPAGTAAAITAARAGARTLLLDRDTFPRPKVCGEFVSAESLSLLGDLLGPEHPLLTNTPQISAGRLFIGGSITDTHIDPPARSIPRFELDEALWHAAGAVGVDARARQAATGVTGEGPFVVHAADQEYGSRAVINASGRWSGVLQPLEPPPGPKWLGLKAHYASPAPAPSVDLYFFRHGYCGVQPAGAGTLNVCAMVRSDVATTLERVLECHPALRMRSFEMQRLGEAVVTAPLLHASPEPLHGSVLQVGDAAGFIDPFLGDGISMALQTGTSAALQLMPFFAGGYDLAQAARHYASRYDSAIRPAFAHAARLRRILSVSQPFQPAVTGLLKIPHITEWFLQKTRPKAAGRS